MIGFRSVLVYDYLEIDIKTVNDILQNNLSDFKEIQIAFAEFI
ncbi:MAG: DUF86 domain-containing protein [Thiotrichaceae bacterium]|nr:DUF86 domain-containing protein [Thiotrichaceae bacterium]